MKLVNSANELARIQKLWAVVRRLADRRAHAGMLREGVYLIEEELPDEYYNLPVVLAVTVVEETLEVGRGEGAFHSSGTRLSQLMNASRVKIAWKDFDAIDRVRRNRNNIAHEGILFTRAECLQMVNHIEAELTAWGVLS